MVEGTEIKEKIIRDGYCYVQNSSYESFKKTTSFLGKEIMKTPVMVRQQKSKGSLVTSSKSLSLHTDHHDAKFIAWFCHHHDPEGGISILSDSKKFLDQFSYSELEELKNITLFEHDVFNHGTKKNRPLLHENTDGSLVVYYSFWLVDENTQKNSNALKKFALLADKHMIKIHLHTNDFLALNNHRVLHGRTHINDAKRHLERIWLC